jgi:restriction system protein
MGVALPDPDWSDFAPAGPADRFLGGAARTSGRRLRLISCVALRTLHEIFSATAPDVVRAVSFAGYVNTTDRASGKPVRPQLLGVSAERPVFEDLVLAEVEPAACLAGLGAVTPAEPGEAEPVRGH